ncbi:MAG TPA: 2-oxoglutarate dehydrogenase complex dihydrolipoyllysine-residue succinyltransferase [Geminicoccus sp.]|jgi:2-oxoglutarate dehydrogenase E2 component (dihydrolipoamide succinyltransferase)|uniref:2-oxoglutarate dehydrogenase complex dihydrolipoyllysine-residue succinyltransferase n=1 Tax=Geminicoccus sp. TaxID=2024832 RepID=UPI002E37253E|nr:2-oxoglutarate dehydrogenase complex dihydrolipoyllysine-residue succinyltransferase [Geminicoccus sp.]HEX2525992.1 2-oxoglutarate dehydrogenase complex dihydrolipoyllysine-residue succinyltransferase [Geminicoccus sp.]
MSVEIRVPKLGESVSEATVAKWLKKVGDRVAVDEPLVELETDKVNLEVPSPVAGVIAEITVQEGTDVAVDSVLGSISEGAGNGAEAAPATPTIAAKPEQPTPPQGAAQGLAPPATPANPPAAAVGDGAAQAGPAARKLAGEAGLDLATVPATGPKGNVTKGDVQAVAAAPQPAAPAQPAPAPEAPMQRSGREERVRMTRLRKRIAERLKEAQNTAAMLTTFNEVDMSAVMALRTQYQDAFVKKHGIKLGFMSFFVKAVIDALKIYPAVNAEIDGDDVVYKHYYDIGVAVSTEQGLVVPVLRDADAASLASIEKNIADLGKRAREGKLGMADLNGGTFTITNGGIFGSLMSTPIINPPQVGILGMHKIQERPVVLPGGRIEARPMMYTALSYDHRIIDGREAVSFLVRVKETIEDPQRLLIEA